MIPTPSTAPILGIDPGYGTIGWGLVTQNGSSFSCINYGCITTSPDLSFPDRLLSLYNELSRLIAQTAPRLVAVEKLFFSKNTKTAIDVSQARGVILLTARLAKLPVLEFTPLQVKQSVTGYGQADKLQIQKMVTLLLRLKKHPTPDDAADALAIAICASSASALLNQ
ncbi:MAG: crossover junction endodeoxyribonuclease RuvC [Patescibacteria group bacterium]|mgnify:CR=1 FL=1